MSSRAAIIIPFILGMSGGGLLAVILKRALRPKRGTRVTYAQAFLWRLLGLQKEMKKVKEEEAKKRRQGYLALAAHLGAHMGEAQAQAQRQAASLVLHAAAALNAEPTEERFRYTFWARRQKTLAAEISRLNKLVM